MANYDKSKNNVAEFTVTQSLLENNNGKLTEEQNNETKKKGLDIFLFVTAILGKHLKTR